MGFIWYIIIGIVAGFLAGKVMRGGGFGLIINLLLGILGGVLVQSPNQKIPDRKTKCVIKTHINIKQNVIFGAKLKPV